MILAPAMDTRPSSLCASSASALEVACVMAAGALFSRFSMVALLLAVLTADFAAFWLAAVGGIGISVLSADIVTLG